MSAKKPGPCPDCGWTHPHDVLLVHGRFTPGGPTGYQARYDAHNLGPMRATREEAMNDWCLYKQHLAGLEVAK